MAKTALKVKQARKPKFAVRAYTRCNKCGRPKAVYRKFGLCRICVRELAHKGELPGVIKSSWRASPTRPNHNPLKVRACAETAARKSHQLL